MVRGRLDEQWSEWLSGMQVAYGNGVTTLTGPVADQPALLGILVRLGNMNLTLISVRRVEEATGELPGGRRVGEGQEEA